MKNIFLALCTVLLVMSCSTEPLDPSLDPSNTAGGGTGGGSGSGSGNGALTGTIDGVWEMETGEAELMVTTTNMGQSVTNMGTEEIVPTDVQLTFNIDNTFSITGTYDLTTTLGGVAVPGGTIDVADTGDYTVASRDLSFVNNTSTGDEYTTSSSVDYTINTLTNTRLIITYTTTSSETVQGAMVETQKTATVNYIKI